MASSKILRDIAPKCYVNQPSVLHVDSRIILDPKEIANSFSDYFSSIVETLILSPSSSSNSNPDFNLLRKHISNKLDSNYQHSIPLILNEDFLKQLSSLPMNVATGFDGASTKLLRLSAPIISQGITNIIHLSLSTGVSLIPGRKLESVRFLKPISILSNLSKIIERHVHDSMFEYMSKHKLLDDSQFGFRKSHSCQTALTRLNNLWTRNMENGMLNGALFLDFRKAFDLVNHNLLLNKLRLYQFDKQCLDWTASYLTERHQVVQFKSKLSDEKLVNNTGVPQDSILGPLLFLISINDFPLTVTNYYTTTYADDATLTTSGKRIDDIEISLNDDLHQISKWCGDNKNGLNLDKTTSMVITTIKGLPIYQKYI